MPGGIHPDVIIVRIFFIMAHLIASAGGVSVEAALGDPLSPLVLELLLPFDLRLVAHVLARQIDGWLVHRVLWQLLEVFVAAEGVWSVEL